MGVADVGAVVRELTKLPVLVVTTHAHWDHIGGHGCFSEIAVHKKDADWLKGKYPLPAEQVREELTRGCSEFPAGLRS
jgi:glyoxylase-like metal-dependent hydrolase (beta-lactamase superfamily II)